MPICQPQLLALPPFSPGVFLSVLEELHAELLPGELEREVLPRVAVGVDLVLVGHHEDGQVVDQKPPLEELPPGAPATLQHRGHGAEVDLGLLDPDSGVLELLLLLLKKPFGVELIDVPLKLVVQNPADERLQEKSSEEEDALPVGDFSRFAGFGY